MAKNFNTAMTEDNKDEWLTPPHILRALGTFDLDPCSPIEKPWRTAHKHYDVRDNGLMQPWSGRVWMNPPYGRETFIWMKKLAEHRSGIALIFARTETAGFHREVWEKAHAVFFFKGRLTFFHSTGMRADNSANAPSCLVSYCKHETRTIEEALLMGDIDGKLVFLRNEL